MDAPLASYISPFPVNQSAVYHNPDPSDGVNPQALSRLELTADDVKEDAEQLQVLFKVRHAASQKFRKKTDEVDEDSDNETNVQLNSVLERRKRAAKEETKPKRPCIFQREKRIESAEYVPTITPAPAAAPSPRPLPTTLEGEALLSTRFAQFSVSSALENRQLLFPLSSRDEGHTLYDSLRRDGWRRGAEPITIVRMPDGLTSFDNRRLAVAHAIVKEVSHSLSIPVQAHEYTERATPDVLQRSRNVVQTFEDPTRRIPADSYGEAIARRVAGSASLNRVPLTDANRWGFRRLPDVSVGWGGRNPHAIVVDSENHRSHLQKK